MILSFNRRGELRGSPAKPEAPVMICEGDEAFWVYADYTKRPDRGRRPRATRAVAVFREKRILYGVWIRR